MLQARCRAGDTTDGSDFAEEPRALGERARGRCSEHYSMQRVGERLLDVANQVLRGKGEA